MYGRGCFAPKFVRDVKQTRDVARELSGDLGKRMRSFLICLLWTGTADSSLLVCSLGEGIDRISASSLITESSESKPSLVFPCSSLHFPRFRSIFSLSGPISVLFFTASTGSDLHSLSPLNFFRSPRRSASPLPSLLVPRLVAELKSAVALTELRGDANDR